MYKENLISSLKKVLNDELSASVVYKSMSEYSVQPKLTEELIKHAEEEFEHFNEILSFCINHGISPEIKLNDYVNNYPTDDAMILKFTQDLEKEAIADYKGIVILARDNNDIETESFFTEIMNDEIEHFDDLAPLNKGTREINSSFKEFIKSN